MKTLPADEKINLRYDISTSLKDLKRIQEDITQLINEKEKAKIKATIKERGYTK